MKCRHGHRWLGDRCVIGWCRQDVEAVDRIERRSAGFTWSWGGNLAVPDQVESESLRLMADLVRVPVAGVYQCDDPQCRLCNSEVWDE